MQTLEQQLKDIEIKIKKIEVLDDDHAMWLQHKVTKRFLLETQYAMMLTLNEELHEGPGKDVGEVAMRSTYIKAMKEAFEMVIDWRPEHFLET